MDSQDEYSGQYHSHPYGEINCVIQLDDAAELKGMQGWQGAGWTSPGAGTHHYPQVRLPRGPDFVLTRTLPGAKRGTSRFVLPASWTYQLFCHSRYATTTLHLKRPTPFFLSTIVHFTCIRTLIWYAFNDLVVLHSSQGILVLPSRNGAVAVGEPGTCAKHINVKLVFAKF